MIKINNSYKRLILNRELASLYYKKGNYSKATEKIKKVLSQFIKLRVIIREIEEVISSDLTIHSEIAYAGGEQNVGCIMTKTGNKEYFTKLSIGLNREHYFYEYVYPIYLKLFKDEAKFISPFIKQVRIHDTDINAIVMSKIYGTKINLKEKLHEIAYLNRSYSSVKYKDLSDKFLLDEGDQEFILFHPHKPKDPITALHSFSSIHKKEVNESLFRTIKKQLKKMKYKESIRFFEELEELILINEIYNKVDPLVNYSIQHGDFYEHNLIQSGKHVYCIDWGCARLGPIATDMAGLMGRMKMPFDMIKKEYLNHSRSNHLTVLDKILFLYILIITWFIVYDKNQLDEIASTEMNNAIEQLEIYLKNDQLVRT